MENAIFAANGLYFTSTCSFTGREDLFAIGARMCPSCKYGMEKDDRLARKLGLRHRF